MKSTLSSLISRYILPTSEEEILSVENRIFISFLVPILLGLGVFNALFFPFFGVALLKVFIETAVCFVSALVVHIIGREHVSEELRGFLIESGLAAFLIFVILQYYPVIKSVVWLISALFVVLSMCRSDNRLIVMVLIDLIAAAVFIIVENRVTMDWVQIVPEAIAFIGLVGAALIIKKSTKGRGKALVKSRQEALALVQKLQVTDKNKNAFLSALSHELRNPLATITAGLQLLELSGSEECTRETRDIMKIEVKQLTNLVDDLLDVTRIMSNKIVLKRETVYLNDVCLSRANAFILLFADKCVGMDIRITHVPVFIDADPVRIRQIIGNLLHNALKFTPEGSGVVRFEMHVENSEAVICISDNGIGIEPQILPTIFEPFVQAEPSPDRAYNGLGLGLPIVKAMTELHGGRVRACSDGADNGASFYIYLPLMPV